jgi:2'-5' RNA ligase
MRLFVGITPSSEAISHAAGAVDRIASTTPDVRWVTPQRWHVTMAFLGEVDPDRVPVLAARLDAVAAAQAPLEGFRLARAGTFRGVLWLGIADAELRSGCATRRPLPTGVQLATLAGEVQNEMRAAGIPVERRPWSPHLTIGRWRPSPERDAVAQRAARALVDYAGPAFDVHALQLVHSVTGPHPEFRDLHVAHLGSGADHGDGTT